MDSKLKTIAAAGIIAASSLLSGCSTNPTITRDPVAKSLDCWVPRTTGPQRITLTENSTGRTIDLSDYLSGKKGAVALNIRNYDDKTCISLFPDACAVDFSKTYRLSVTSNGKTQTYTEKTKTLSEKSRDSTQYRSTTQDD